MFTITPLETAGVQLLPFDIRWNGQSGDFFLGGSEGLLSDAPLATAVVMLLFTDCRGTDAEMLHADETDRRGWMGDGFDVDDASGEAPLGSRFWLFRREALTDAVARKFVDESYRALDPLIKQNVVARIEVAANPNLSDHLLQLSIALYGRDGARRFAARFDIPWSG